MCKRSGSLHSLWSWGHPLKGKSQDKNPSLLKKPHKKSFYLYRHYDYAHLSISHPLFLLFLVTKKFSSNYSAPVTHQDQGSICTLPFRLKRTRKSSVPHHVQTKTISQTFWLLCPTPSGSWYRRNSKLFIIMWQVATDYQSDLLAFYQPPPRFTAATFSSTKYFLYLEYLSISHYIVTRSCYLIC